MGRAPDTSQHPDTGDGPRRRVAVITGGGPLSPSAVAEVREHAAVRAGVAITGGAGATSADGPAQPLVVAADSGLDHARAAGIDPDLLVGDLDSISPAGRAWAEAHCRVQRHDPDKAATDTELAIVAALDGGADELVVIAGDGDRIDHQLATIGAAGRAAAAHPATAVRAWIGTTELRYVTPAAPVALSLPAGTTFSLLAVDGPAGGITIAGARWPLAGATLTALSGLGISNIAVGDPVIVSLLAGIAVVVIPVPDGAAPPGCAPDAPDQDLANPNTTPNGGPR